MFNMAEILLKTLQVIVAVGLLNVWLYRANKTTPYRGGEALTLKEEFQAYGLPNWYYYTIGTIKVSAALSLLLGLWWPSVALPTAVLISLLMLGAIIMHLKVGDPYYKIVPATTMLVLSLAICVLSYVTILSNLIT
jgi:hypothetical protein